MGMILVIDPGDGFWGGTSLEWILVKEFGMDCWDGP